MDLSNEAWQILNAAPWFHLIDSLQVVQEWLASPENAVVDRAVTYLSFIIREEPDRVAEIAQFWVGRDKAWNDRLLRLMSFADLEESRPLFDLYLRLLSDGVLDEAGVPNASNVSLTPLHGLSKKRPEWACELLVTYYNRHLDMTAAHGKPNLFDGTDAANSYRSTNGALFDNASSAPGAFVEKVLPLVLRIIGMNIVHEGDPPWPDRVWPYHFYGEHHGLKAELLGATEAALRSLAQRAPEDLVPYAACLRDTDYQTAQYLLIRAYQANGQRFADEAIDYLCEKPARLHTGYVDNGYWATRQLLEAATPYCSEKRLLALEEVVLGYYSQYERSIRGYRKGYGTLFGVSQLTLLNGINEARRSPRIIRRLEEWRRKFRMRDNAPARGMIGGVVGSPLQASATEKMTDKQWLAAITQYTSDTGEGQTEDGLVGGAYQLSSVLQQRVEQEPGRFAELVLRFPDDANPHYFDAVLRGLATVNEDVGTVLKVCQRCRNIPGSPSARWICDPIRKVSKQTLPEELLEIVGWYATEATDPDEEVRGAEGSGTTTSFGGDLEMAGMNSARGTAALAMAELIFDDRARAVFFLPYLERLVQDPSLAVRSCAAEALTATLNYDRDLAVSLFLHLCEADDVLLGTHSVERFLHYASYTHYGQILPVLERELGSENPKAVSSGARLACLNALLSDEALPLARRCLNGTDGQRDSAAQVFAVNLGTASNRTLCEQGLRQLFHDDSGMVREKAAACFSHLETNQVGAFVDVVDAFVASPSFLDKPFFILQALKETTAKLPDITCSVCERFLDHASGQVRDVQHHALADASTIGELVIRTYSQSTDAGIQKRCLDIIDRLTKLSAYSVQQALTLLDR